jgi:UDP-glucuronate decarboxylase
MALARLIHKSLPTDATKQRLPDIRLCKEAMGCVPGIMLEEGLKSTVAYFEQLPSIKN